MSNSEYMPAGAQAQFRTILRNVYLWMTAGLGLTAAIAWWAASTPAVMQALFGRGIAPFFVLVIAELVLVIVLSRRIMQMSVSTAVISFIAYASLNGLTLSLIFLAYTSTSIVQALVSCSAMYAVMSIWAVTTKRDLSGLGHYLFMGLIGLIIAGVLGMFFRNEAFHFLYSAAGVVLFTILTAYDTQMIKKMSDNATGMVGESDYIRLSILGALKLYLDFINLFLFLLRLFGRRR